MCVASTSCSCYRLWPLESEISRNVRFQISTAPDSPAMAGPRDGSIDWKRQFKIKTNWSNGKARLHELAIAQPPAPPVIAKVHRGLIFTVDRSFGLRVWSQIHRINTVRAQIRLQVASKATCIAVETVNEKIYVLLGFEDGSFSIYVYEQEGQLAHRLSHQSFDGPLLAVSLASPFAITVSRTKFLGLYQLHLKETQDAEPTSISTIARLQSDASFSPISVALRHAPQQIIATVAYAFSRLRSGWCLAVQEIRLTSAGCILDSRLASTLETPLDLKCVGRKTWDMTTRFTSSMPSPLHTQLMSPPTSLSYEHPFLIGTLADNTIVSFLVTSNDDKLEIGSGRRLWGHTSAVSGAEVNNRGKAVSISCRGDETRVWELETLMKNGGEPRMSTQIQTVDALSGVAAALARRGSGLGLVLHEMKRELRLTRRWVGFDEEQVVVLVETRDQKQIMALYDFT